MRQGPPVAQSWPGIHCVDKTGLDLTLLSPECWNYRHLPPCPAYSFFFFCIGKDTFLSLINKNKAYNFGSYLIEQIFKIVKHICFLLPHTKNNTASFVHVRVCLLEEEVMLEVYVSVSMYIEARACVECLSDCSAS